MTIPGFLKKKRTYVILVLLIGVGYFLFGRGGAKPEDAFETAKVEKSMLARTVDVTGEVKPAERIALSFESGGTLSVIHKQVGEAVKTGDVLAELESADLTYAMRRSEASLQAALANLNLKIAGETPQAIRVAETDVQKAQASYDKSVIDLETAKVTAANSVRTAELSLSTAQLNLTNQGATNEQSVADAYADLRLNLLAALGPMQTAMTDGDRIIGVDDTASNSTYKNVIGIGDSGAVTRAEQAYKAAKPVKALAESQTKALTLTSTAAQIDEAAATVQRALELTQNYLTDVQKVLAATISSANLTETTLASFKSQIDSDRSGVSTQKTTVENGMQIAINAKLGRNTSRDQLINAEKTAALNLDVARAEAETTRKTAESNMAINKAGLEASKALLDLKKSGPREVDLAPLRASVSDAQVAFDQANASLQKIRIIAPVDGIVSEIIPTIGEQLTANTPAVRMIGVAAFDIELLLPEADVAKVKLGQTAKITLDAYGDNVSFEGTVVSEEPDQTLVQDAVYYKARIQIAAQPADIEFKPGMTANVTILTAKVDNALIIPARAVRTEADKQTIRVLENGQPVERTIKTGLRGDEGRVEVIEGVKEGETIIVSERT